MTEDVAVVYLARYAEGADAFSRFINSYKLHPAGIEHKLIIIYKGFQSSDSLNSAKQIFGDTIHDKIVLDDTGFDIGSYFEASKAVGSEYLCFLNTHSEISANNWLKLMMQAATRVEVGLTGAMGSYESIKDSVNLYRKVILKSMGTSLEIKKFIAEYFDFILRRYHSKWYLGSTFDEIEAEQDNLIKKILLFIRKLFFLPKFYTLGTQLIWLSAPKFKFSLFPSFPNPHIRSNGFLIKSKIFRGLIIQNFFNKFETSLFESGPKSMTNIIKGAGFKVVIVGKDGEIYDEENWGKSRTFRQGDQSNLLIHDNHTRAFANMSAPARQTHEWLTWGIFNKNKKSTIFDCLH